MARGEDDVRHDPGLAVPRHAAVPAARGELGRQVVAAPVAGQDRPDRFRLIDRPAQAAEREFGRRCRCKPKTGANGWALEQGSAPGRP